MSNPGKKGAGLASQVPAAEVATKSFGNAHTLFNSNSSHFGKCTELQAVMWYQVAWLLSRTQPSGGLALVPVVLDSNRKPLPFRARNYMLEIDIVMSNSHFMLITYSSVMTDTYEGD